MAINLYVKFICFESIFICTGKAEKACSRSWSLCCGLSVVPSIVTGKGLSGVFDRELEDDCDSGEPVLSGSFNRNVRVPSCADFVS